MKKTLSAVLLAGVMMIGTRALLAADEPATQPQTPTIFVCGDSTSKNSGKGKSGEPVAGWGTPIAQFFDPAKATVNNVGHAGTSSLSYYQGDWPNVLPQIHKGDFVLIVFGINDGGLSTPNGIGDETANVTVRGRAVENAHTYGWYMSKMATDSREKGATPYFLTVTARNIWTNPKIKFNDATPVGELPADYDPKQDKIERGTGNGRYGQWTKEVGIKLHVPVFDLTNYCADLYEKMGREEVNKFYSDHNHTYVPGAEVVAKSIVAGLKSLDNSPFVALLSDKGKAIEPADKKYISDNLATAAVK